MLSPEFMARFTYLEDGRLLKNSTGRTGDNNVNNWGYRYVTWDRGTAGRIKAYAHVFVWELHYGAIPPGSLVDHINGDKLDNRIVNLRLVDKSGNAQNARHKGYFLDSRSGKYCAQIKLHGKAKWLGAFSTAEDARAAYLTAKKTLHTYAAEHTLT